MPTKMFTIDFYQGQLGPDGNAGNVWDMLNDLRTHGNPYVQRVGSLDYEIRIVDVREALIHGVLQKYRHDNIPHAGQPGSHERELELAEAEGLIEKNHFVFFRQHQLLLYQKNGNGCTTTRFGKLLGERFGEALVFHPVLQRDPMIRLMRGENKPRVLDLRIARPTNRDLYPASEWNRHLIELLNGSEAMKLSIRVQGDGRSETRQEGRRYLWHGLKDSVSELLQIGAPLEKAKVELEDGQIQHPIDLIADRMYASRPVEMVGRYPAPSSMFAAMESAYEERLEELRDIFGQGENSLA